MRPISDAKYSIGIDPGWKNLGVAVVRKESGNIKLIYSATFNPSESKTLVQAARKISGEIYEKISSDYFDGSRACTPSFKIHGVMERYVSYTGVHTAEAENILMMIGALASESYSTLIETGGEYEMVRAIDWKKELVKLLFKKKGFSNPSDSLDKKFSVAAAKACLSTETEINTNHEADAICMACLPFLREK
ncbi:Crossover junction endodeoxyribonuclease RuvC [compost metagenome]